MQLHDREALLPREGQRRFLEGDGWVAWPGPALAEFVGQFVAHNRMLEGGFVIDERLLTLADIRCPILSVVGTVDEIAPAPGVRAIRQAAPRADVYELALHAGHFGLVVGSTANAVTWPTVAAWARWRDGEGELPEGVGEVPDDPAGDLVAQRDQLQNRLGYGVELAGAVGGGIARSMVGGARRTTRTMRELVREAAGSLPQLARLEQIQPSTRVSLGLLVEERVERGAADTMFLYEDRAYSALEVNQRIDNVVRGLISIGVRQGEHVGVLMGSRPSALAVVTALSRLGAVAVMLRPDGNTAREASLGAARRIIADPERAAQAAGLGTVHTFVLGGGGGPRDLRLPLTTDMEQIDPRDGDAPGVVSRQPRAGVGSGLHPLHRRGRLCPREPGDQPAVGHLGLRHRFIGCALAQRHRLQRHPALSPLGADDGHRRGDRRGRPAGHGHTLRSIHVLGRGPPLRRDRHLLHLDAAARPRRRARQRRPSAATPSACSSARGCREGCGAASRSASRPRGWSSSTPPPRPERSSSTSAAPSPGRWADRCPAPPRCGSPPTTRSPSSSSSAAAASCSAAAPTRWGCSSPGRAPATPR